MNKMLYTILLLLACTLCAWAQVDSSEQQRNTPSETGATGKEQPEAAAVAPETKTLTPDTFTPSEEISEDLSVSYPVDI